MGVIGKIIILKLIFKGWFLKLGVVWDEILKKCGYILPWSWWGFFFHFSSQQNVRFSSDCVGVLGIWFSDYGDVVSFEFLFDPHAIYYSKPNSHVRHQELPESRILVSGGDRPLLGESDCSPYQRVAGLGLKNRGKETESERDGLRIQERRENWDFGVF